VDIHYGHGSGVKRPSHGLLKWGGDFRRSGQWRNHVFKVGGSNSLVYSRLLYRTKYGWYTQFRALQSVT